MSMSTQGEAAVDRDNIQPSIDTATGLAPVVSRKRTYEQITRSTSRSVTPSTAPVTKRRRILPSTINTAIANTTLSQPSEPSPSTASTTSNSNHSARSTGRPRRCVGDGLDFRRPTSAAMSQAVEHSTIDLTLEDDSDEAENTIPASRPASRIGSRAQSRANSRPRSTASQSTTATDRATRTTHGHIPAIDAHGQRPGLRQHIDRLNTLREGSGQPRPLRRLRARPVPQWAIDAHPQAEVIDISSEDEDDTVEITGIRPVQGANRITLPPIREIFQRNDSTPPPNLQRADAQTFADTIRNALPTLNIWPGGWATRAATNTAANLADRTRAIMRRDAIHGIAPDLRPPEPLNLEMYDPIGEMEDYDNLLLDYGATAFVIEDPARDEANEVEDVKMSTLPTRAGFTRDLEENDEVLICVNCEDEMACPTDDEIKQQVWVSKKCGHTYCGSCASRRAVPRGGNDRDRKRSKRSKHEPIKRCPIKDCNVNFTSKGSLVQVYL